jgi:hypothetical protein
MKSPKETLEAFGTILEQLVVLWSYLQVGLLSKSREAVNYHWMGLFN